MQFLGVWLLCLLLYFGQRKVGNCTYIIRLVVRIEVEILVNISFLECFLFAGGCGSGGIPVSWAEEGSFCVKVYVLFEIINVQKK